MVYGEGQRSRRNEEQEALFKKYKSEVKNMLAVSKSGICHQALKYQVEDMIGKRIPILEMGYNTWSQFLYDCKDILDVGVLRGYSNGKKFVFIRDFAVDASIADVHKLVREQERGKPKKTRDGTPKEPTRNQCSMVDASQLLSRTSTPNGDSSFSSSGGTQFRGSLPVRGNSGYNYRPTNLYQPKPSVSVLRSGYQNQRPSANPYASSNMYASSAPAKSYSSTGPSRPMALPPGLDDDDDDYVGGEDDFDGFDYCSGPVAAKVAVNSAPKVNSVPVPPASASKVSTTVKRLNFLDLPVRLSSFENPETATARGSEYLPLHQKPELQKRNEMITGERNHNYRDKSFDSGESHTRNAGTQGNENIKNGRDAFITKVKRLNLSDLPVRLPSPPTDEPTAKATPELKCTPLQHKKADLPTMKKLVSEESNLTAISSAIETSAMNNKPGTIKKDPLSFDIDAPPFVPQSYTLATETIVNETAVKIPKSILGEIPKPKPNAGELPKPKPSTEDITKPKLNAGAGEILKPKPNSGEIPKAMPIPNEMSPAPAMVLRKGQVCQISVLKFERSLEYDMIMRLFKHVAPINQLESEMTNFYESAEGNEMDITTEILEEGFYAVFCDGKWVRANLQRNTEVTAPLIPVFLLDHGKFLPVTDMKHIRHLKAEFTKIRRTVYFAKLLNTELDVDKFRRKLDIVGAPHITFQGAVTSDQSNVPVVFVDVKDY